MVDEQVAAAVRRTVTAYHKALAATSETVARPKKPNRRLVDPQYVEFVIFS